MEHIGRERTKSMMNNHCGNMIIPMLNLLYNFVHDYELIVHLSLCRYSAYSIYTSIYRCV